MNIVESIDRAMGKIEDSIERLHADYWGDAVDYDDDYTSKKSDHNKQDRDIFDDVDE